MEPSVATSRSSVSLFTLLGLYLVCILLLMSAAISQQADWPPLSECKTHGCPVELAITPCVCTKTTANNNEEQVKVTCSELTSVSDLARAVKNMEKYCLDSVTIALSDIGYLPSNLFLGVRVRDIQIRDTPLTHFTEAGESAFLGLEKSLQYLSMRRCQLLSHLKWERIGDLDRLISLDLTSNLLDDIPGIWFDHPPQNLQLLYLKNNQITTIHDSAFASLHSLRLLDLSENNITEISRSMFSPTAKNLTFLYLSYNKISSLPPDIFTNMPSLRRVYLDFNRLQILSENAFVPVWGNLQYLDLIGNKIWCDCSILWMTKVMTLPWFFYGHCEYPLALRRKALSSLWPWDIEESSKVQCNSTKFTSQGRTSYDKWFHIYRKSVALKYNGRKPMQMHHRAFKKAKYSELPDNEVYLG